MINFSTVLATCVDFPWNMVISPYCFQKLPFHNTLHTYINKLSNDVKKFTTYEKTTTMRTLLFFSVNSFSNTSVKYGLTLYTKDDSFQIGFPSEQERDMWMADISFLSKSNCELPREPVRKSAAFLSFSDLGSSNEFPRLIWHVCTDCSTLCQNFFGFSHCCELFSRFVLIWFHVRWCVIATTLVSWFPVTDQWYDYRKVTSICGSILPSSDDICNFVL